jgi:hypothetical protein
MRTTFIALAVVASLGGNTVESRVFNEGLAGARIRAHVLSILTSRDSGHRGLDQMVWLQLALSQDEHVYLVGERQ